MSQKKRANVCTFERGTSIHDCLHSSANSLKSEREGIAGKITYHNQRCMGCQAQDWREARLQLDRPRVKWKRASKHPSTDQGKSLLSNGAKARQGKQRKIPCTIHWDERLLWKKWQREALKGSCQELSDREYTILLSMRKDRRENRPKCSLPSYGVSWGPLMWALQRERSSWSTR